MVFGLFDFYCTMGGGFDGMMTTNPFTQFCEDCEFAFKESAHCHKSDLDRVFIAADTASNKMAGAKAAEQGVNRMKALSLDEFVTCLVTIGALRHIIEETAPYGRMPTMAHAVDALFDRDILPRVDSETLLPDPNHFRQQHCCE